MWQDDLKLRLLWRIYLSPLIPLIIIALQWRTAPLPPPHSIDPPGCTDVDDALHVRRLPSPAGAVGQGSRGLVEVGVHIADVSYFVQPGSMLDGEARDRCTSVYLVDR